MEEINLDEAHLSGDCSSNNISPRLRARKSTPMLITLSSDSESESKSSPIEMRKTRAHDPQIIEIECIATIKEEVITDEDCEKAKKVAVSPVNEMPSQEEKEVSSVNSDSKDEKENLSVNNNASVDDTSPPENENLEPKAGHSKKKPLLKFLKGKASKSQLPRMNRGGVRKGHRWSSKYFARKLAVTKNITQRPIARGRGRVKKFFGHMRSPTPRTFKRVGRYPLIHKHYNDESSASESDVWENDQSQYSQPSNKIPVKKVAKSSENNFDMDEGKIKKRGRPKSVPDGDSKKKRGRPKLSEARMLIKKKASLRPLVKDVLVKKRGRPKLPENEKKKGRPKVNKDEKKLVNLMKVNKNRTFLQTVNCLHSEMRLPKCRECRRAACNRSTWNMTNSYCRFLEYRKLVAVKNGNLLCAGFLHPSDSSENDKLLWLPNRNTPPEDLNADTAKELLIQVGDQFCDLVQQEKEALSLHVGRDKGLTWKKAVQGVREMCDVCDTTLFNIHWVCPKCGLAVCIDCYKVRKQGIVIEHEEGQLRGRDEYLWLICHNRIPHEQDQLIMAQMLPGDSLWTVSDTMHKVREKCNIEAYCKCVPHENIGITKNSVDTGICKQLMCNVSKSFATISVSDRHIVDDDLSFINISIPKRATKWLPFECDEKALRDALNSDSEADKPPDYMCYEMFASVDDAFPTRYDGDCLDELKSLSISEMIECIQESRQKTNKKHDKNSTLKHFNSRYPQPAGGRDPLPLRIFTSTESSVPYKDIPHSWLCNGRLLLLHQPDHVGNLQLFQEQWKRGQPIMVMGVDSKLDMTIWHPEGFCSDFGDIKNDLVNCRTGAVIPNMPMRKFWLGFENFDERMKDDSGEYMLLKLKDWPPGEDFSEKLPKRFQDLMKGLPLPEYTHRDGIFNLAGRLPTWFVRPDLGPKMYNAYGSALYPTKGTTNLHLDVSDAVNVMVYVGIPHDGQDEHHILEALKAIDEGGCDSLTRERVRSKGVKPGALWHIYDARNVDKIRDLLNKVAIERGEKLEAHHDPIHDQSWYLDTELRKRLYKEYGVEGYAIAQCLGDAVFIPAGAPHQVRNLHSCVKVAEDFVSPENIAHCFKLTQEFRHLSDTHTNHEDKLQIKNIIYHVVKDALSHLLEDSDAPRDGPNNLQNNCAT